MIKVVNLTKSYRTEGGRHFVFQKANAIFPAKANIGILGPNGGGKSTLLRLLGGIDHADSGRIVSPYSFSWPLGLKGGFVGHLAGRENCRMVCNLYGLDPRTTKKKLEEMKELSGIGKFFEEPVKTYSSGMSGRLGFALSMSFDFDYFLIDEITSVGDANFKRIAKEALAEKAKKSRIIMVSHSMGDIKKFCDIGVLVRDGHMQVFEDIDEAIRAYMPQENRLPSAADLGNRKSPAVQALFKNSERLPKETADTLEQIKVTLGELEPKLRAPTLQIRGKAENIYHQLGRARQLLGDLPNARRAFEQAVEANPFHIQAQLGLAATCGALGDLEGQANALKAAEYADEAATSVRLARAQHLLEVNRLEEALQYCDYALAQAPELFRFWNLKAKVLFRQGDIDGAVSAQLNARTRAPNNHSVLKPLAEYLAARGELELAQLALTEASRLQTAKSSTPKPSALSRALVLLQKVNDATHL